MQIADLVSFAFYRAYQWRDWNFADALLPALKRGDGKLIHLTNLQACDCPACTGLGSAQQLRM